MKIKCVIADDEPMARKGLRGYVEKIDFLTLVGECEDAIQLNTMLKNQQVDLIFLDIEMPEMSGLELLLNLTKSPKVIIVSAYEQYALKGYEFDVIDYLLKPVSFDRFLKSVNKVHDQLQSAQKEGDDYIFEKSDKQLKRIVLKEILFIQSMENYVVIQTASSKEIVYTTLQQIYDLLPPQIFQQVHRSYIVNINHVNAIDGNVLNVDFHKIPISRNYKEEILNIILKDRLITKK